MSQTAALKLVLCSAVPAQSDSQSHAPSAPHQPPPAPQPRPPQQQYHTPQPPQPTPAPTVSLTSQASNPHFTECEGSIACIWYLPAWRPGHSCSNHSLHHVILLSHVMGSFFLETGKTSNQSWKPQTWHEQWLLAVCSSNCIDEPVFTDPSSLVGSLPGFTFVHDPCLHESDIP